jgi:membrane fusion protein, multidrug efflux system
MRFTTFGFARSIGLAAALTILAGAEVQAQPAPQGPPAVGVLQPVRRPVTESSEFLGRIEAVNRVNVVARVTAFIEKRIFQEGTEVSVGDPLYSLERGPFQADLATKQAQVEQLQASLDLAKLTTERQRILLTGPAGQQSNYDSALANERSLGAQVQAAEAQVKLSQINLDYTDIRSPIDGRIGRTAVTDGNVVSPSSGVLTTIVSQDPMYVTFPVSVREAIDLRDRYANAGGFGAVVIRIKQPNGKLYNQTGKLDFVENTIAANTDTILLRGTIPNPKLFDASNTNGSVRELVDGEFVSVLLESVQPVQVLAIPRSAVLSDQQGEYVFVIGPDNKAERRGVQLGQSTSTVAAIMSGLSETDKVIVEGLQRVRLGQPVAPGQPNAQIESMLSGPAQGGQAAPPPASTKGNGGSRPAGSSK